MAKEEKSIPDEPATKVNRRQFLKLGASTGIAMAAATVALEGGALVDPKQAYAGVIKTHDEIPYEIPADHKRYNQRNHMFGRARSGDPEVGKMAEHFLSHRFNGYDGVESPGYTVLDGAAARASFALDWYVNGENGSGNSNTGLYAWRPKLIDFLFRWGDPDRNIHSPGVKSPEEGTMAVKRMAKYFGAHSVGIAPYDERWIYTETFNGEVQKFTPPDFGFEPKHAIVMTIPMEYKGMSCAPTFLGSAEVGRAYNMCGVVAFSLSIFIKDLGYHAVAIGSDTSISIPQAIQAGLGELGRMGLLVTPDLGPSVRICKVFTDMPLNHDKPISFGVTEFCNSCKKCAELCPSQAISYDAQTTVGPSKISSASGVKKWYINPEKCWSCWGDDNVRSCCGACIAACPYTKPEGWHHTLVRSITGTPGLSPIMKNMDDLFGYGKLYNEQAATDWWKE
ncbi:1,1-dichloroethane dehalogenase [Dehalobacter sp. MCB1]|uniref:reductive dehalogenase n=1 Tax=unclassified Dehalobacter TaxID=2635733 RepID=UPI000E6BDCDD|nr:MULTISPECIES: reductive dehalogenase [unclassified Dehalobacter]RJE47244.1 1,1-dichloroethane dehalogenase [Dehalobacter sp. MCB1]TCX54896.1 reductive dehalogenase [Dehalobacter sp. 12DCB1]